LTLQGHWWIGYEDHGKGNGWFRGHEDEGKYSGICFLGGPMPEMASTIPQYAPDYWIQWGYDSYASALSQFWRQKMPSCCHPIIVGLLHEASSSAQ
jgi:hypothetical protein